MKYKDLIFKITSDNNNKQNQHKVNSVKAQLQSKDILIGIMSNKDKQLSDKLLTTMKSEIERTLTVLLHSPISDNFGFLPFSRETLDIVVDTFPNKRIHYIADEEKEEYTEIKELKATKLNITNIYKSNNKLQDFTKKINYLVTINQELEPTLKAKLDQANIMVFPIDLLDLEAPNGQKEKLVKPDGTGWIYNSASGMWLKTWGNDGMQQIPGW